MNHSISWLYSNSLVALHLRTAGVFSTTNSSFTLTSLFSEPLFPPELLLITVFERKGGHEQPFSHCQWLKKKMDEIYMLVSSSFVHSFVCLIEISLLSNKLVCSLKSWLVVSSSENRMLLL